MTAKTVLKGFPLMVLQSQDGLYYSPRFGWIEDINGAKVYKRPGDAKCAMTAQINGYRWCSRDWSSRIKWTPDRLNPLQREAYDRCLYAKVVEIGSFSAKV